MDGNDFIAGSIVTFLILLIISICVLGLVDEEYRIPQAAENANQFCQEQGYDFYERFERIGILSSTPVAIECKYVQNYQEMDIALRQTFESAGVD